MKNDSMNGMKKGVAAMALGLCLGIIGASVAFAHGDHSVPGTLPPEPHGGTIRPAEEVEEHDHESHGAGHGAAEPELFFEAVYRNKQLTLYPLVLKPESRVTFAAISAAKDLSDVSVRIEFPRAKKFEPLPVEIKDGALTAKFDSKKANRFIVHILSKHGGEKKLAKVPVEEK